MFFFEAWCVMANTPHILIVDDDRQIRMSLCRFLAGNGLRVSAVADGAAMFEALGRGRFDLIVLDIMMPGEDGLVLCRRLREASRVPVIFLTALSSEIDCVVGLELGADDYISKPIRPRELLARIRVVLRRVREVAAEREGAPAACYEFEGWRLNAIRRTLRNPQGTLVELTGGEFDLLLAFAEHPQHILAREQLLDLTRGKEAAIFDRSIDVQISRLRRKIEIDPQLPVLIKTVRSGGYVFCANVTCSAENLADAVS
jgi:two-component system, OmpR family, response regulator